ncbi:hypothetical protein CcCBS67573_g06074 [Chytriomyces confervae]|uniref:Uncharacterized protein n=1 Tax=Chytriomyces confervae TaxID=246404 RepID=A0A507F7R9_9FUNG|nr:hypothetical protein CcCBS67573_g06074 [Chytriomyces confervae]
MEELHEPDVTIDLPAKYIAVLEERMQLAGQLTEAMRGLRAATDKLEALTSDLTGCRQEVLTLAAQLEALQADRAKEVQLDAENKELQRQVTALKAQGAMVVGVTRESTAVRRSSSRLDAPALDSSANTTPQLARSSKRLKLATDNMDVDASLSLENATLTNRNSVGELHASHPTRQSRTSMSALMTAAGSPVASIDEHVVKIGSGSLRIIKCKYCSLSICGDHRARWVKHVGGCTSAPESTRALFSTDLIPSSEDIAKSEAAEDGSVKGAREGDDHTIVSEPWDPNERVIDHHVLKRGVGPSRVVSCRYCSEPIRSKERKLWTRHVAACLKVPESTRILFGGQPNVAADASIETPSADIGESITDLNRAPASSVILSAEESPVHAKKAPDSASKAPVQTVSVTELAPLRPYPTDPPKTLMDGSENTLRFRAWMDIVRYQKPGYVIVNATGLKMTTFKKLYNFKEVRMVPETSTSKFSNGCYAIPEYLQQAFMAHFKGDPRHVIVPEDHQTPFAGVPVKIITSNQRASSTTRAVELQPVAAEENLAAAAAESKDHPRNPSEDTEKNGGSVVKPQGTRYISIIRGIMPEFQSLPDEARKAVKRGVRLFLEAELGASSSDWVLTKGGGTMYMVPDSLVETFKEWKVPANMEVEGLGAKLAIMKHKQIELEQEIGHVEDETARARESLAAAVALASQLREQVAELRTRVGTDVGSEGQGTQKLAALQAENAGLVQEVAALRASLETGSGPKRSIRLVLNPNPNVNMDESAESSSSETVNKKQRSDAHATTVSGDDDDAIDSHVVRTGSGSSRKVNCVHCDGFIKTAPGCGRREWRRHMRVCTKAPAEVKKQFATDKSSNSRRSTNDSQEIAPLVIRRNPAGFAVVKDDGSNGDSTMKENAATHGDSASAASFPSKSPRITARLNTAGSHQNSVPDVGAPVVNSRHVSGDKSSAYSSPKVANLKMPKSPLFQEVHDIQFTALKPYDHEPPPFLHDGTPNTEGYRSWSDVIKYQIPTLQVFKATGLKVTSFKRLHKMPEIKVSPHGTIREKHMAFGIPENMQAAFVLHVLGRDKDRVPESMDTEMKL